MVFEKKSNAEHPNSWGAETNGTNPGYLIGNLD